MRVYVVTTICVYGLRVHVILCVYACKRAHFCVFVYMCVCKSTLSNEVPVSAQRVDRLLLSTAS